MRVLPMFNTVTIDPYITQPTTTPFRWGCDFNHWVPWMFHYPLHPQKHNHSMRKPKLKKPPGSLNESNASPNRFRIFCRSPIPSTRSAMINIVCHTSFRWEINFGCTCRKNTLHDPNRGNTSQGNLPTKISTLLCCQSRATPAPRQVAHLGPNST
jgi:hypothetical protein